MPTKKGNTNVANRYKREAEPAAPVPAAAAKSRVNTNSVEPIHAGEGSTAASITDRDVTARVWGSVISPVL